MPMHSKAMTCTFASRELLDDMNEAVNGPNVDKDTDDESLEDKLLEMNAWGQRQTNGDLNSCCCFV